LLVQASARPWVFVDDAISRVECRDRSESGRESNPDGAVVKGKEESEREIESDVVSKKSEPDDRAYGWFY